MAHDHANGSPAAPSTSDAPSTCISCAKTQEDAKVDAVEGQPATENTFTIAIRLPHEPYQTQTIVSTQDQAQDIRQSLIDAPQTFEYSCFHLEHQGKRLPDFVDLSDFLKLSAQTELSLVEDPYTEKDARLHLLRIRDLLGASGDKTSLVHGVDAGATLHDHVLQTDYNAVGSESNGAAPKSSAADLHALSGYDIKEPSGLNVLLPPVHESAPRPIKSISLSPWNPPPYHLRNKGHLLYIQVTTNEGEQHQITAHVSGFYVNKCSSNKFDPFPRTSPKSVSAHSLLTLVSRISPSFDASFKLLQEHNSKKDPLSTFQPSHSIPASPWIVSQTSRSLTTHFSDICRTQESFLVSGVDNAETLRDWNEEFQTTRELPKETVQDRVFRERVTSKLYADYNEAAVQGAVLIARGEVAPLNPTENRDAQIFVYNNVFYSFGADGVGTFASEGGDEAARVATGKDVSGVRSVNQLDIQGLCVPGTVVVDYLGKRIVGQSIVPGIFKQREPGEQQIDYGGVEGKDVVAENEAFVPLFKKLSKALHVKKHPVWDKEGERHVLEASVETKGLLGTDGRKYALDLYRLTPLDVFWIEQYWVEPPPISETGSQPQENIQPKTTGYPHRMTVLRPELVDAYWRLKLRDYAKSEMAKKDNAITPTANGHNHDRANGDVKVNGHSMHDGITTNGVEEHTESSTNSNADQNPGLPAESEEAQPKTEASETDQIDISEFNFFLNPDVYSGQQPQSDVEKEELAKDEAEVRKACQYLYDDVMPRLIEDLREGEVGFPMDGQSLTSLLHKRGINVRYLGKVSSLASNQGPRLQALTNLAEREMVARAFKHIANRLLRQLPSLFVPSCVAHLLNCLLGTDYQKQPKPVIDSEMRGLYPEVDFAFEEIGPQALQDEIIAQLANRFRYDLDESWFSQLQHLQLLREVSLKLGLQLAAKDYDFTTLSASPVSGTQLATDELQVPHINGHTSSVSGSKKKKKNADRSPIRAVSPHPTLPQQTFHPDDVINVVPLLKEASPKSVLAEEALEAGRISVVQNQRELGQELLLESLSLHEQIYGILHPEVARVYYQLSTLFYTADDKNIAVELARKAVIVSERTLGIDSNETILGYLNLGLFEHANGNTRLALQYVRHALDLWKVVFGPSHPDSITTLNNIAVMLQNLRLYHESRLWFESSLAICQENTPLNASEADAMKSSSKTASINTATLLFQLAQALALDQDSKAAVNRMREAYNIFNTELGANHRNTKEAEHWLEQLTQNAVSIAKHAKDMQNRKLRRLNQLGVTGRSGPGRDIGMTMRPQPQVGQTESAAAAGKTKNVTLDDRSVQELVKFIEGGDAAKVSASSPQKKTTTANPKRRR